MNTSMHIVALSWKYPFLPNPLSYRLDNTISSVNEIFVYFTWFSSNNRTLFFSIWLPYLQDNVPKSVRVTASRSRNSKTHRSRAHQEGEGKAESPFPRITGVRSLWDRNSGSASGDHGIGGWTLKGLYFLVQYNWIIPCHRQKYCHLLPLIITSYRCRFFTMKLNDSILSATFSWVP